MAEKLDLDLGTVEFVIGSGSLRFNPSNPRIYQRFIALLADLPKIEEEYSREEQNKQSADKLDDMGRAASVFVAMERIDGEVMRRLSEVFGPGNDLHAILGDESLMGFGSNGERIITNLLTALTPYIEQGAKRHMQASAAEAVAAAKANRAQRRTKA